jgi:hypothetical protein
MALDLTGITNENEFYTEHYLKAILEGDLRGLFDSWNKLEKPPYTALLRLARQDRNPEWWPPFFEALGYDLHSRVQIFEDDSSLELAGELLNSSGAPYLWIIACPGAEEDPLTTLDDVLTKKVFTAAEPPRWVLVYSEAQVLLLDRTKWAQKRLLRFDLSIVLGRREPGTLKAMAALLHRDSIAPESGTPPLLDTLDESSHKHAFAVSEDLKYAAREAVELLGNEAVWYLTTVRKEAIYNRDLAKELTRECLRYLYRLLFLFYVEARPELGYAPMKSEEYRTGYSLESLRDIVDQGDFLSDESRNGRYLHQSLVVLFSLIWKGVQTGEEQLTLTRQPGDVHVFRMQPLQSDLFDPEHTPILNGVKFRNSVLQRIITLLSLSRENDRTRRGRISYRQLGINQLGAVYEGLLSYTGFFAEPDDLYEVKKADEEEDALKQAYFVPLKDLDRYKDTEKVYDADGRIKRYPKGTFIYRLAGRDRQKSASYYTPEVLTRCVVKYALKELLQDKTPDQILRLTVCEPALGSGAFLNEALEQLSEAYLEGKQKETGETIAHDAYSTEKQKVKAYMAGHCVFGVDRNPVAIELAQISLWLNTIYEGHTIPWFGAQLAVGNSLIGARRQRFRRDQVLESSEWLTAVPTAGTGQILHWLLPDKGMALYTDKAVKEMCQADQERITRWRKPFTTKFNIFETNAIERLTVAAEKLWRKHAEDLKAVRSRAAHLSPIFGQSWKEQNTTESTASRDRRYRQVILSESQTASSPYRRLGMAMDYWCALWFWPIERSALLPSRDEYLLEMSLLLEGTEQSVEVATPEQPSLLPEMRPFQGALELVNMHGMVDVDTICVRNERLRLVREIAQQHRFFHWELVFADIFVERGGFDLVIGNPPWIKVEWNESGIMGDIDPICVIRGYDAPQMNTLRRDLLLQNPGLHEAYLREYVESAGLQNFLNAAQNFPLLQGSQSNLYKCFIERSWTVGTGVQGFVHPEGIYDDPNGGKLRATGYQRLRFHFQFQNASGLFPETAHRGKYSANVYGRRLDGVSATHIANLFIPSTIDSSLQHDGRGLVGGIKDHDNHWNIVGHASRVINIDEAVLGLFANLYDDPGTPPLEARLPALHSRELVEVLRRFAAYPRRLGSLEGDYKTTVMWDETGAVQNGTIKRDTQFPIDAHELVLSGPHFSPANPFAKTPRAVCTEKSHYDPLDLTELPLDYLPRTNYRPACERDAYLARTPVVPWGGERPVTDFYRMYSRRGLSQSAERTLLSALVPPEIAHIDGCFSIVFKNLSDMLCYGSGCFSLVFDFFVKSTGKSDFRGDLARQLPVIRPIASLHVRALVLNCLTERYAGLWRDCFAPGFVQDAWTKSDRRLCNSHFCDLTAEWRWSTPLRTDYSRRQALIEIDVLVARSLGMTLTELCTIYRIQFPVLQQYERNSYYDRNGRIIYLDGDSAYGYRTPDWKEIAGMTDGAVTRRVVDDTLPGGPRERIITYVAPFDRCDREADYATAWAEFDRRENRSEEK